MRSTEEIKERVELAIVEAINKRSQLVNEPENLIPAFIQNLTNTITEIVLDEIEFRRRY